MNKDKWELQIKELEKERKKRLKEIQKRRKEIKKITERTLKNKSPKTKTAQSCYEKKLYICGSCGFSSEKQFTKCPHCEKNSQKISKKYIEQISLGYDKIIII